ncbi:winged helix-turn-helix transcriptional regulator [Rhodobacteraceae bacterium NNCM2]|nr:winged helix-turn-helix transcriptional regulator [Coraliihabitans acroporae]
MTQPDPLSDVLSALADPSRRQILTRLRERPLPVGELVGALPLTQPGVTRHLGVLERAGLIRRRAEGRRRICELTPAGLRPLDDWLSDYRRFWTEALDKLAELAEEPEND